MKNSEIKKLVAEYKEIKSSKKKSKSTTRKKLGEIERRFFHETGKNLIDEI